MPHKDFSSPAWLLTGLTGSVPGTLELSRGRLAFTGGPNRYFDVPLDAVQDVNFPWHYFGGGVKFRIGAERYRVSFVQPGESGDIGEGRRVGKAWKQILKT